MKPDLILHIGQSKTGTSSIQRVLGGRRAELRQLGICYPTSPGHANHGMLPASFVPLADLSHFHPNVWEGLGPEVRLDRFRRDFAAELDALPEDTRLVVISAEQCSGLLHTRETIARLHDLLAPRFARMRVVFYMRRQDAHYASGYTQGLRVAHITAPGLPPFGPEKMAQYDYAKLLADWAAVFGEAAMQPRVFERASLLNGDVVDDFLALAGIGLIVPADDADRRSNLSLTPGAIDLVRAMGERLMARPEGLSADMLLWRRFMVAISDALPGPGWKPPAADAAAFVARFAESNEATRRRWFPDRPALFAEMPKAPDGAPEAKRSSAIDTLAALDAACALLVREMAASAEREATQYCAIGRLHDRLNEPDQARGAFRAALRAVPDQVQAQQRLAESALAEGDVAAAAAHLVVLQASHPDHPLTQRVARLVAKAGLAA